MRLTLRWIRRRLRVVKRVKGGGGSEGTLGETIDAFVPAWQMQQSLRKIFNYNYSIKFREILNIYLKFKKNFTVNLEFRILIYYINIYGFLINLYNI